MKMTLNNPDEVKIFILFLLDRVGVPLSYSDLGTIVIRDGVIDYFAYFEYFCELVEAGHIAEADADGKPVFPELAVTDTDKITASVDGIKISDDLVTSATLDGTKYPRPSGDDLANPAKTYVVSKTGRLIARSLSENILMAAVREKSYESAMRHLSLEKMGAVCDQTFERSGEGFIFHCTVKDKDGTALDLALRADTVHQLNRMRLNFDERPDVIMRGIIALLTGNVNYLFEE